MRYESELLELMATLKQYLLSIRNKYDGLIDMDDLYQECLMNAVKSSSKSDIKDPKKYFKGVFRTTIQRESLKKIREFKMMNTIEVGDTWEDHPIGLIEAIDMRVKGMKPTTRRVWSCLKTFYGDRKLVCKALGSNRHVVKYHGEKLYDVYQQVLEN